MRIIFTILLTLIPLSTNAAVTGFYSSAAPEFSYFAYRDTAAPVFVFEPTVDILVDTLYIPLDVTSFTQGGLVTLNVYDHQDVRSNPSSFVVNPVVSSKPENVKSLIHNTDFSTAPTTAILGCNSPQYYNDYACLQPFHVEPTRFLAGQKYDFVLATGLTSTNRIAIGSYATTTLDSPLKAFAQYNLATTNGISADSITLPQGSTLPFAFNSTTSLPYSELGQTSSTTNSTTINVDMTETNANLASIYEILSYVGLTLVYLFIVLISFGLFYVFNKKTTL